MVLLVVFLAAVDLLLTVVVFAILFMIFWFKISALK
jgi:hypothetical protein